MEREEERERGGRETDSGNDVLFFRVSTELVKG